MGRAKIVMVWLIPVLWLVASIPCLGEVVSLASHESAGPALSLDPGSHCGSATSVCSFEQSTRRLGRRLNIHSGPDGLFPPVAVFENPYPLPPQPAFSSACFQPELELTKSWQFLLRAAVE